MDNKIEVLIVDDHGVVREGLGALIHVEPDMELVGEARDGIEAIELVQRVDPDVIVMDLSMPRMGGIEAIRAIKAFAPETRILVLTSYSDDDKVFPAIEAGALGYMLKDSNSRMLMQAIRVVAQDEPSLHPKITEKLIRGYTHRQESGKLEDLLTNRERETLILLAKGLTNQVIADQMFISELTVRSHVSNILSKLDLANRTQAALFALRRGMTGLDDT